MYSNRIHTFHEWYEFHLFCLSFYLCLVRYFCFIYTWSITEFIEFRYGIFFLTIYYTVEKFKHCTRFAILTGHHVMCVCRKRWCEKRPFKTAITTDNRWEKVNNWFHDDWKEKNLSSQYIHENAVTFLLFSAIIATALNEKKNTKEENP